MRKKWSENEIKFLKNNYSNNGIEYCKSKLNRTKISIIHKANRCNLFLSLKIKNENIKNIKKRNNYEKYDLSKIKSLNTKEVAYFLGYFWADGVIYKKSSCVSQISLIENDSLYLYDNIISNIGKNNWTKSKPIKKQYRNKNNELINAKNQILIRSYSRELYEFLYENDYFYKSNVSFEKIFTKIPNEYKSYFILGLFDGDGSFTISKFKTGYIIGQFIITSTYNYDWKSLENYFKFNNIEYSIYKKIGIIGKYSLFVVRKKESLFILYNLLYGKKYTIGLSRKYLKFKNYMELKYKK